ncbi:MAG: (2Fe-2S) ferredoxin domain-containing protein [Papillibacter sp.]|jgi:NADH:ubiquinone oxidoreductase subunit E|nr:(2Fe-2S) ferredoxin domain-containing protein [Papillibacter sp.]
MTISVCVGSSCHIKGSKQVIDRLRQLAAESGLSSDIEIVGVLCMDNCMNGVSAKIDGHLCSLSPDSIDAFYRNEILPKLKRDRT